MFLDIVASFIHKIHCLIIIFLKIEFICPGADHQIPMELVLKIVSKIRAGERFAVYVVVPMWPEGDPKTNSMQEILFWQVICLQLCSRMILQRLIDV